MNRDETCINELVKIRLDQNWLIAHNAEYFPVIFEQSLSKITATISDQWTKRILISEPDPVSFLAHFLAAKLTGCSIFIANPNWKKLEWKSILDIVKPQLIFGHHPSESLLYPPNQISPVHRIPRGAIMIPTGGTSGQIRFAIHTWETLMASVQGFQNYFAVKAIHSYCVLPLFHVSGLMQFLRSFVTGGTLILDSWKTLENQVDLSRQVDQYFISLVPTQLQRLLQDDNKKLWLSQFKTVLLGGAPSWLNLLNQARKAKIPLAPTYGMTETASQIVTLKPEEFLAGNGTSGHILPHAQITIRDQNHQILDINQIGLITIQSTSLALGYYPHQGKLWKPGETWTTDDLGFIDQQGYLTVIGRGSDKIITGGENVYPAEVEAAIQATGLVQDVGVVGVPDAEWGQMITAVYVPQHPEITTLELETALQDQISKFKQPKRWISVSQLPRNEQGKINRHQLQKMAGDYTII